MSLQELINQEKLKTIKGVSLEQVGKRIDLAKKYFNFAVKCFKDNSEEYGEVIYTNLYNAARVLSEAVLLMNGYKADIKDHHKIVIQAANFLINDDQLSEVFARLNRMRKERHNIDYDIFTPFVSKQVNEQSIKDIQNYINKVEALIDKKNPQKRLIDKK